MRILKAKLFNIGCMQCSRCCAKYAGKMHAGKAHFTSSLFSFFTVMQRMNHVTQSRFSLYLDSLCQNNISIRSHIPGVFIYNNYRSKFNKSLLYVSNTLKHCQTTHFAFCAAYVFVPLPNHPPVISTALSSLLCEQQHLPGRAMHLRASAGCAINESMRGTELLHLEPLPLLCGCRS